MHKHRIILIVYFTRNLFLCLFGSVVDLPATDGSVIEHEANPSHILSGKMTYLGPQMPISVVAGLSGDRADNFEVLAIF